MERACSLTNGILLTASHFTVSMYTHFFLIDFVLFSVVHSHRPDLHQRSSRRGCQGIPRGVPKTLRKFGSGKSYTLFDRQTDCWSLWHIYVYKFNESCIFTFCSVAYNVYPTSTRASYRHVFNHYSYLAVHKQSPWCIQQAQYMIKPAIKVVIECSPVCSMAQCDVIMHT